MDVRLQEMEKQSQENKQSAQEEEVQENCNIRDNIKEMKKF
jgi:hypothetical protein